MDTPYKWPPGRDYRGYSIRTLFCRVPFGEPHVGSNATASLWQCGVNLRAHGGLKRHQAFEVGGETPEPWWAHTLRATHTIVGARMERIQPTNPEPTPGEEPTAQWERRRPRDWASDCGDINPRLITLRGRSMRSRITSLYPCADAVHIYTGPIVPR